MNDTPQGDGNIKGSEENERFKVHKIRMNDTPQGDGNSKSEWLIFGTYIK